MAEVVDYSLKHQFLGSLQGSGGEHQLSDEQVEDDSQISVVDRNVNKWNNYICNETSNKKKATMQVNQFWRDGFLAGVPVLSEDDCDKLLEEVDAVSFNQNICK